MTGVIDGTAIYGRGSDQKLYLKYEKRTFH